MTPEEAEKRVLQVISERLERDEAELKPEASFADDLKADSLDLVEIVLALEKEFDIEIPDEDTEKIRTVSDATNYIKKRTK